MKKCIAMILVIVVMVCVSLLTFGCDGTALPELDSANPITDNGRYLSVAAPINNVPNIVESATDNEYNYYFIDLGYAKGVPISSGTAIEYNGQTPITVSFEKSIVTQDSVSKSLTKAVSETVSVTSMGSATFKVGQKFKYNIGAAKAETSINASYSRQWGTVTDKSNSTSDTYETATSETEELREAITYTIGDHDEEKGVYRLSLIGTCDIYAVVQTNLDNSSVVSISYTLSARDDMRIKIEYDDDGLFDGNAEKIKLPTNYYLSLPLPEKTIDSGVLDGDGESWSTIAVTMDRYNCKDDGKYNKTNPDTAGRIARHDGFEIGTLSLYGCRQVGSSYYKISCIDDFAIRYMVLQDINDLPRNGCKLAHISNDTASRVLGTNIGSKIGYGAYWVRITYTDDSQEQYNETNILKYASNGTNIDILSAEDLNLSKKVQKIDVVVAYELYAGAPGFLDIWWHEYTNWRCEYTYEFN